MKKLVVFIVFLSACSANLVTNSDDPVETTINENLTVCEALEAEYIESVSYTHLTLPTMS